MRIFLKYVVGTFYRLRRHSILFFSLFLLLILNCPCFLIETIKINTEFFFSCVRLGSFARSHFLLFVRMTKITYPSKKYFAIWNFVFTYSNLQALHFGGWPVGGCKNVRVPVRKFCTLWKNSNPILGERKRGAFILYFTREISKYSYHILQVSSLEKTKTWLLCS